MQFASKCAVFQIYLDKIHLYFCDPFLLMGSKFNVTQASDKVFQVGICLLGPTAKSTGTKDRGQILKAIKIHNSEF